MLTPVVWIPLKRKHRKSQKIAIFEKRTRLHPQLKVPQTVQFQLSPTCKERCPRGTIQRWPFLPSQLEHGKGLKEKGHGISRVISKSVLYLLRTVLTATAEPTKVFPKSAFIFGRGTLYSRFRCEGNNRLILKVPCSWRVSVPITWKRGWGVATAKIRGPILQRTTFGASFK